MKIEILTSVAGANFSFGPGFFVIGTDITEEIAFELLRDGIAVAVSEEPETASIAVPEVAVTRGRGRPRGSRNRTVPDAA